MYDGSNITQHNMNPNGPVVSLFTQQNDNFLLSTELKHSHNNPPNTKKLTSRKW